MTRIDMRSNIKMSYISSFRLQPEILNQVDQILLWQMITNMNISSKSKGLLTKIRNTRSKSGTYYLLREREREVNSNILMEKENAISLFFVKQLYLSQMFYICVISFKMQFSYPVAIYVQNWGTNEVFYERICQLSAFGNDKNLWWKWIRGW